MHVSVGFIPTARDFSNLLSSDSLLLKFFVPKQGKRDFLGVINLLLFGHYIYHTALLPYDAVFHFIPQSHSSQTSHFYSVNIIIFLASSATI